jgi:multiple sugar transport system substrate-binding protein
MRRSVWSLTAVLPLLAVLPACNGSSLSPDAADDGVLEIWWNEGYYPEETEAVRQAVSAWSAENNIETELLIYSEKDLIQYIENAVTTGEAPDIIYGQTIEPSLIPRLAWEGRLADTTALLEPIRDRYTEEALEGVSYLNRDTGERSYYAVPIAQQTINIHYWRPLLAQINRSEADIAKDWQGFWQFWQGIQLPLRQAGQGEDFYSIGLPMSPAATDTSAIFEQFLEAYDIQVISPEGELLVNDPQVVAGIAEVLRSYTQFFPELVPPSATGWSDPDNNVIFLSRLTAMTVNPTLSIPGSQRQDPSTYQDQMATLPWPSKPSGDPMRYISSIKQAVIWADSNQQEEAAAFLSDFIEPANLSNFVQGAQGRYFPVMPEMLEGDFWNNPEDPHITVAVQQLNNTRPLATVYNAAYSEVQAQNVWGNAIYSIVAEGATPEEAAESAVAEIKRIFSEWN